MSESATCGLASLPPQLSSAGSDCVACPAVHPRAHSPLPSCQTSPGPCAGLDGVSFLHSNPSHGELGCPSRECPLHPNFAKGEIRGSYAKRQPGQRAGPGVETPLPLDPRCRFTNPVTIRGQGCPRDTSCSKQTGSQGHRPDHCAPRGCFAAGVCKFYIWVPYICLCVHTHTHMHAHVHTHSTCTHNIQMHACVNV